MQVTITDVPHDASLGGTEEKIERLVVPFVKALRDAYIKARISDDENATKDVLTDILVYADRVEGADPVSVADEAAQAALEELHEAGRQFGRFGIGR